MPVLEQVRGIIRLLQTFAMELFAKIVSSVNLRSLSIVAKRPIILNAWSECASKGVCNTVLKIKRKISPWKFVKMESPKSTVSIWGFRSVNCLGIRQPLKQLLKVPARCFSQGYLSRKFSANYYQSTHLQINVKMEIAFWTMKTILWDTS